MDAPVSHNSIITLSFSSEVVQPTNTSPVAEKTYRNLRYHANRHPEAHFVAISHSTAQATEDWIIAVGGEWDTQVIVDEGRSLYALWGLGISNSWHVLNPWSLYSVYKLGKSEGIWNRPTESGSRWQTSGSWAVDGKGVVRWGGAAKAADEIPDLVEALLAVGIDPKKGTTQR